MENKTYVVGSGPAWFPRYRKSKRGRKSNICAFLVLSDGFTNPKNNNKDALVDGKEHDDDIQKSVSLDIQSSSCGNQIRIQGNKAENKDKGKSPVVTITGFKDLNEEFAECINNSSNGVNAAGSSVSDARLNFTNSTNNFSVAGPLNAAMPNLEDLSHNADDVGAEADINNMESIISVSPIPTTRIHKDHPTSQIIGDLSSTTQTRSMARGVRDQGGISQMFNEDFHTRMFACFLLQEEPKRKVWILVDLPYGKRAIGTKWVYRNKKDERGIVIRNKARLVAQGHTQKEGFEDPEHPDKVYKVVKALYGLHQAPRAWYETLATYLLENGFQRGTIDHTLFIKKQQKDILLVQIYVDDIIFGATNKALCQSFEKLMKDKFQMSSMGELTFFLGLQVKQKKDGIFISQDKYIAKILRKFGLSEGKSASTLIDAKKPLLKDSDGEDVDVHTYRSMIGSLMYLTSSRPDIMFAVCACARFQVTLKVSHLNAVKRIFRYLKGKPLLGLWYPKDSPFDLVAYSDNDYAVVATSSTEAEYVAAASGCAQVLWMQNQLLDYGVFNSPMLHVLRVEMVINSPWLLSKNWLVQKQTALGKDTSNPLIADSLLKTIWFSTYHITCMKSCLVQKQTALGKDTSNLLIVDSLLKTVWFSIHHHLTIEVLAIRGQTATGKESSNPFMACSLPKTILYSFLHKICFHVYDLVLQVLNFDLTSISSDLPLLGVNTPRYDEDRLELMELMVFLMLNGCL
nr:hypothetical protein [Tanacetum cinerariifolium]